MHNRAIDLDFSECPGIDPQSELAYVMREGGEREGRGRGGMTCWE